jgi:hypothetical protein
MCAVGAAIKFVSSLLKCFTNKNYTAMKYFHRTGIVKVGQLCAVAEMSLVFTSIR